MNNKNFFACEQLWDLRMLSSTRKSGSGRTTPVATIVGGPAGGSGSSWRPLKSRKKPITSLVIQPENSLVFAAARDRVIRAYDESSLQETLTLNPPHYDEVHSLALSGRWLFSSGGIASGFLVTTRKKRF